MAARMPYTPWRRPARSSAGQITDGFTFDVKLHRFLSRHAAPLDTLPKEARLADAPVAAQRARELLGQAVAA